MLGQRIRKVFRPNGLLFQIIAGCSFGWLLGLAGLRFSPLLVFGTLAAALLIYTAIKKPAIALLGLLAATSSIVFEEQMPMISVGISLHIPDILLLGAIGLIAVRWLVEPEFKIVRTPLDLPLLIFIGVTLLSTFIALLHSSVDVVEARRWIRVLLYYLTFFIVTNLVRDRRQLEFLLNGFFLVAVIVAVAMVMQFLLGDSIRLIPGRVETLETQGTLYENIPRIAPPGFSIVLVSFVTILCILVLEKSNPLGWFKFFLCGLLGIALLLTFLRTYWVLLIMMFVLLGYLLKGANRQRFIEWGLLVISLAAIILLLVINDPDSRVARLVDASLDRISTIGNSKTLQGQDGSLNWRKIENGYALSTIAQNPWIGLGMGFTYRPWDRRLDLPVTAYSSYDFRKHIHNSHFWILLQSGLVGYLAFIWFSLAFLMRGFKYWRSITTNHFRGVVLGFALVYLLVLFAAVNNSTFMQQPWTPVIGIVTGINEVILMRFRQEEVVN